MFSPIQTKKIAFKIPFNLPMTIGSTIIKRSNEWIMDLNWIRNRLNIFMAYTLKSLKNQTNQDFVAYILYHTPSESMILKELKRYEALPHNIKFIKSEDYSPLIESYIQGSQFYYEIELGSDDLYHKDFVQYLYNYVPKPTTRILICQDGYILSSTENVLAEYFNYSSSFNCWIYKTRDYLNKIRYSYEGYTGAIKLPHEIIPWRAYINHSHKTNIAFSYAQETKTPWGKELAHIGTTFTDSKKKQAILNDFLGSSNKIAIISIKFNIAYDVFGNKFQKQRLTQEWIDYRIDIFMKYTYQSLINQTNQHFIAFLHYDPTSKAKIQHSLKRYPPLQSNIKFVPDMDAAINEAIQNYTHFFLVHLDSDNMFHPSMIKTLFTLDVYSLQYVICQSGYILDLTTQRLAFYSHPLPDTFYTFIYSTSQYLSGYRMPISPNQPGQSINIATMLSNIKYTTFSNPLFIITIHNKVMTHDLDSMFQYQTARYLITNVNEQKKIFSEFKLPYRLSLDSN